MPLINAKYKRTACGTPYPSTCVGYDGSFVGVLDKEDFECNVNLDDVIEKLSLLLKSLQDEVEVLTTSGSTNTSNITALQTSISQIQTTLANLNATQIFVNIDLGCLASDASPCEVSTKRYSLFSILQLFKNEICLLKA